MSAARPHTLLVGPRGSGKSHLLRVALHRLEEVPQVRDRLAIAQVPEDAVGITRYADLLHEIARSLNLTPTRRQGSVDLETAILDGIGDRVLVVVVENLDRVFRSIGLGGQQNLRSWVETSGRILLLAATPALFTAVSDRAAPWFAGLITMPVEELSADEGRELMRLIAQERGDTDLAAFLDTPTGAARVEAIAQLTGGSPRIWMVLADCVAVDTLDRLVPAVEELLESLVPYYQSLLWDLPDNQQAIVRALAEGWSAALTAADIAEVTGLSPQTVSKALGLLEDGRWVRSGKAAGGDRRKTWYRLREPLLRHHFQWRNCADDPLALIVELLRSWHSPREMRSLLAGAMPLSTAERYLAAGLALEPPDYDSAYATTDPDSLLASARLWLDGNNAVFTRDCGRYAEAAVLSPTAGFDARAQLARRFPSHADDDAVAVALSATVSSHLPDRLAAIAYAASGATRAGLLVLAAGWIGHTDPRRALDLLSDANSMSSGLLQSAAVAIDTAFWTGQVGRIQQALELVDAAIAGLDPTDAEHTDLLLTARGNRAGLIGQLGRPDDALHLYQDLLPDSIQALGATHPDTLVTRGQIAYFTGAAGHPDDALRLYQDLLPEFIDTLGATHPHTLTTRDQIAHWTGATGHPDDALHLYQALLPDVIDTFGATHPDTLATRGQIAYWTGITGHPDDALHLYQALLPDRVEALGATHSDTLNTRRQIAYWTWETGLTDGALRLLQDLLPEFIDTLGATHPHTLTTRSQIASCIGATGHPDDALRLLQDLLPEFIDTLGATHPNTLTTRANMAYLCAVTGNVDGAVEELARDPEQWGALGQVLLASPTTPRKHPFMALLWRALHGDPEARTQVPDELQDWVTDNLAGSRAPTEAGGRRRADQ